MRAPGQAWRGGLSLLLLGGVACQVQNAPRPHPRGRFYFPTGVVHQAAPSADGILFVANSNFDKRFDFGAVTAVRLSNVDEGRGLPPIGAPVPAEGPRSILSLGVGEASQVEIESLAGEMEKFLLPSGATRLFVPSRAEGAYLQAIDSVGDELFCQGSGEEGGARGTTCSLTAPSLTALEKTKEAKPRAPAPIGVGISREGDVFVTHAKQADDPPESNKNLEAYVVTLDAEEPSVTAESFISLGAGAGSSVAVGQRYAFVSGRYMSPAADLVRLVDRTQRGNVLHSRLEFDFLVADARGIALSADERRLYLLARSPDLLLVIDLQDPANDAPGLRVVSSVPIGAGPNQVKVIGRSGRGDLLAVTCSNSGSVVIYDAEAQAVTAQVFGVGDQPYGIAVDHRGSAARLYVTDFGDGRVAVIDLPDLSRSDDARLVAHLGATQTCYTDEKGEPCETVP